MFGPLFRWSALAVLLVLEAVALVSAARDHSRHQIAEPVRPRRWAGATSKAADPRVGSTLPDLPLSDGHGAEARIFDGRHAGRILVVGACTGCESDVVRYWLNPARISRGSRARVLFLGSDRTALETGELSDVPAESLLFDPTGAALTALNPWFTPRAYGIAPHGQLLYVQARPAAPAAGLAGLDRSLAAPGSPGQSVRQPGGE